MQGIWEFFILRTNREISLGWLTGIFENLRCFGSGANRADMVPSFWPVPDGVPAPEVDPTAASAKWLNAALQSHNRAAFSHRIEGCNMMLDLTVTPDKKTFMGTKKTCQ